MNQQERDRAVYALAKDYLPQLNIDGVTPELIEKYLHPKGRPQSIAGILVRLLESAKNANMKDGVITGSIGEINNLKDVLFDFEPTAIIENYPTWQSVFDQIKIRLKPKGKMRDTARAIFPLYCRTILSASQFMAQFSTADDFYEWVDFFDKDERARPALPLLLAQQIVGFGFTLACDFLKELGYINFAKPDVQLREIFEGLGLCPPESSDFEVFNAIIRVAQNVKATPYSVDKIFWLIGSGKFYDDKAIGKNGRIGSRKKAFIQFAQSRLSS